MLRGSTTTNVVGSVRRLIQGGSTLVLAVMVSVGFCPASPSGGHALGGLIHACRMLGRPDEGGLIEIGGRTPTTPPISRIAAPSLRMLCEPRHFRAPTPTLRDGHPSGSPLAL